MHNKRAVVFSFLLTLGTLFLLTTTQVHAGEKLWGALLLASNDDTVAPIPARLDAYSQRLSSVFGYSHFRLIGESTREVDEKTESWLIPGDDFFVRTMVIPTSKNDYQLGLEIYCHKKKIADTVAKLGKNSPLFIRGPQYGKGQLILVVMALP